MRDNMKRRMSWRNVRPVLLSSPYLHYIQITLYHITAHTNTVIILTVTVTVTEALVVRHLHHTVNPYPGAQTEWNRNVFRSRRNKSVDRSSLSSVGSLFHARGAATEKALSPIRQRVRGTTRRVVLTYQEYWQPMSEGPRSIPACVQEATCEPASTTCTGSSQHIAWVINNNLSSFILPVFFARSQMAVRKKGPEKVSVVTGNCSRSIYEGQSLNSCCQTNSLKALKV